jgi:hypothetical protein
MGREPLAHYVLLSHPFHMQPANHRDAAAAATSKRSLYNLFLQRKY